jgi:hypothetical protein
MERKTESALLRVRKQLPNEYSVDSKALAGRQILLLQRKELPDN